VKASINANHANFTDFDSVKDAYVEFRRTENPTNDPRTRQVASVACGGRQGRSFPRKHDRGQGLLEECDPVILVLILMLVSVRRPSAGARGSKKSVLLAFLFSIRCL
jgi:hypothetical protein